jgi:predicted dehydrogenase
MKAWSQIVGVRIVALANRTKSKALELAQEFGIPSEHVYSDHRELLEREELDFVDIATAPHIHRVQVEDAASHGVNILCQKPFSPTLDDAKAMIAASEKAGVLFSINDNWRWRSWYRDIKDLVAQNKVGKPHYCRIVKHVNRSLPLVEGELPVMFANQLYMLDMEKLIVYEWGIHLIDILRFLFGEIISVYARMERISPICRGEDRALITLDAGGVTSLIDISWASIGQEKPFCKLENLTIEGEEGTIELLADQSYEIRVSNREHSLRRPAFLSTPDEAYQASYTASHRHFADCLRNGITPETVAQDNIRTLAAMFAAYESARNNQVVALEQYRRYFNS